MIWVVKMVTAIPLALCLYIDSSFFLVATEKAFHILQHLSDPVCKGILEHITILPLDADLSIFNQKCLKHTVLLLNDERIV